MTGTALDRLRNGLIVSCQAAPGSPLANRGLMSFMAEAAEAGFGSFISVSDKSRDDDRYQ